MEGCQQTPGCTNCVFIASTGLCIFKSGTSYTLRTGSLYSSFTVGFVAVNPLITKRWY